MSLLAGWREKAYLPELELELDAKLDTGARSCALHVSEIETLDGGRIRFAIALDKNAQETVETEAELLDWRFVKDSSGHGSLRPFIRLPLRIAGVDLHEEVSLTDRFGLRHRLLIGRNAMKGRFLVDPEKSFLLTRQAAAGEATP